jgi:hypothetical protein
MGIEKETQQFATVAEKMPAEPKDDELMPQTLDRFKRFARASLITKYFFLIHVFVQVFWH